MGCLGYRWCVAKYPLSWAGAFFGISHEDFIRYNHGACLISVDWKSLRQACLGISTLDLECRYLVGISRDFMFDNDRYYFVIVKYNSYKMFKRI